ncbi:phosphate ABC transporter ATP-binding protein [Lichenifustis flavocetrariae]|uniref:ATP-binding cassette domain-containing protein n=1 Tax=Lichenifustis flavocetrariae TaxID=2949735 RepID=A0AA41Z1S6_9HYPH|nr:phosphate ABC transporter ATP-binding protein [Lichenifustis flavocetrariae]MCW6512144.1 ATP-binding cassette domain-containing protein [Lichenifustis flavocetrariae]
MARLGCIESGIKISIQNLDFFYGTTQALRHITLDIEDRSVTALVGPSGCGKSTLLRCLNRLYDLYPGQHATGEILMDGKNILDPGTNLEQLRADVSMVFQASTVLPMSIFDNVALPIGVLFQAPRSDRERMVETALRDAAIWDEVKDILTTPAASLSGGQQQRLCIARAIGTGPAILLFDEPCSALDPISTAHIEALIGELAKRFCVVIVTHNMQQAARVADVTAFMYLGDLVEVGKTEQIFSNPKDPRTRDYVTGRFG